MYQPKIATHMTPKLAEVTFQLIKNEAETMTEAEITTRVQELMAEGDKWSARMIHTVSLQDSRDKMYLRWVNECSEMAAMWCMVEGAA